MGREEFKLRAKWLAHWCGMVTRFEPTTGSTAGAPDTHVANAAVAGFVEFKVVEAGGTFEMRQSQMIWHNKYSSIMPNSCFCVLCPQGFWLIPSKVAVRLQKVVGEPLNWDHLRGDILTFAIRHVFSGRVFHRGSVEHLIEPLVMVKGVGHGRQKAIQRGGASQ
jgi:hypothetical protein